MHYEADVGQAFTFLRVFTEIKVRSCYKCISILLFCDSFYILQPD